MSYYGRGLDNFEPLDGRDMLTRDTSVQSAATEAFWAREEKHNEDLDEMIRMGWGDTDRKKIPADWRERKGPVNEEVRKRQKAGGIASAKKRSGRHFNMIAPSRKLRLIELARRAKRVRTSKNNAS